MLLYSLLLLCSAATLFGEEATAVQWPARKLSREGLEEAVDGGAAIGRWRKRRKMCREGLDRAIDGGG
ncbi:hypothetical protein SLEP1_g33898 [Rubroshorea leprosula]|uniref:Uncharacterized protein n=1 Tax=Rubroshorea leprosula TaxID=152421 RepID=A0AAV5KI29_9ROSI|nr:hypothetical protein SLEP1_g33898 [Rubroshorea leprosula]